MVSQSKARQIKAKRSLAWQIFSHVRFVFVASVRDILVRISFKEIFLTGFVDLMFYSHVAPASRGRRMTGSSSLGTAFFVCFKMFRSNAKQFSTNLRHSVTQEHNKKHTRARY